MKNYKAMKNTFTILEKKVFLLSLTLILLLGLGIEGRGQTISSYSFTQAAGTYTAIAGTTAVAASTDDAVGALINIGFTFTYHGVAFTQFAAGTNGYIQLGAATSTISPSSYGNIISFMGRDGKTNGAVTYLLSGTAPNRVLTVQFPNWYVNYSVTTNSLNAQIKLYETTNVVQIVYGSSAHTASYPGMVGLTGATTADFSTKTTSFAAATTGAAVTTTMPWSSTIFPANGRTFTWTPPAACIAPTASPTALLLTSITSTGLSGSFTAASPAASGYLIVRSTSNTLSANPVNGTVYTAGNTIGGGTVVQFGATTTFSEAALTANTTYYYFVFSYNNTACSGGPLYLTGTPLTGNATTLPIAPVGLSCSVVSPTSLSASWTASAGAVYYYYEIDANPTFDGTWDEMNGSTSSTTATFTGLTPGTTYYIHVASVTGSWAWSGASNTSGCTTPCSASNIPYNEGFESIATANTLPSCMVANPVVASGGKNQTYIASATGTGFGLSSEYPSINFLARSLLFFLASSFNFLHS
jgi:hypothetical protein